MRGFPMKILIADDHPVVRHGLKQMLTGEPDMLVVGEAKNGNEAMELARKLEWDVAILDYSMPGRSGLQLLGEIKREFPQRPVMSPSTISTYRVRILKKLGLATNAELVHYTVKHQLIE